MPLPDALFGGCPNCWGYSECLNVGADHWFVCHDHQVAWFVGSNLFGSWRNENEETWRRNSERLKGYEIVSHGWLWIDSPGNLSAGIPLTPSELFAASDPDASVLLDILRQHWKGRTFVVGSELAEALGWAIDRLQRARLKLLEGGLIERVEARQADFGPRYRFSDVWGEQRDEQDLIAWDDPCLEEFYASDEWRRLRYNILKKRGRRCECCGATADDGARIVVDHIKPIRRHWHLRLDPRNCQVLCDDCNRGKGSRDETDWRSAKACVGTKDEHISHQPPAKQGAQRSEHRDDE